MASNLNIKEIDEKIKAMKGYAEELKSLGNDFPDLYRNSTRILAGIKMLEINISDMLELGE